MRVACLAIIGLILTGCASYEYDLVQPRSLARHIGAAETSVAVDPLVYRLQTVDSHLVMQIQNPTGDPIMLVGDRSVIVDPDGQSHRIVSQTIAPGSFIKFILPPFPEVYAWDDSYGIGVRGGYWVHRDHRVFYHSDYGFYDDSRYVAVYDSSDPAYFEWSGETDVRMTLKFDRNGNQFDQSFVFHRRQNRGKAD